MADEKIRYVLDVDDKGTPKIVKFGTASEKSGKQAEKAFDKAGKSVKEFGAEIPVVSRAMSAIDSPAAAAGAALAAVGVGMGVAVKRSIDFADNINDLSLRLGVSTERLSVLSLYAEQSGTDIESVASAMGKLGAKLSEGDKALSKYKITATSVDGALYQIADRIKATEDPMLRLKIATDVFGKSGQQMLPMLVEGGDALRAMADSAPIVSTEFARMADNFNDRMAEMKGRFTQIGLGIAENVLPWLDKWLEGAERIRKAMGMLSPSEAKAEARQKVFDEYYDVMTKDQAARSSLGLGSRQGQQYTIGGKTLAQSLAAVDAQYATSEQSPASALGVIGAGATTKAATARTFAESYQFGSARADYMGSLGLNPYAGGAMSSMSVDGSRNYAGGESVDLADGYFAGLPTTPKAQAAVFEQYKKMEEKEIEATQKRLDAQQAQYKAFADSVRGDLQSGFGTAFQDIWRNGRDVFSSLYDSFSEQFTNRAISSLATVFSNLIIPGGGGGGILGLLGFASGGNPPAGVPSVVGERRAEMLIPQGPSRVAPTSGGGLVVNITVSNPAEARSTVRQLQKDGRTRSRGIR